MKSVYIYILVVGGATIFAVLQLNRVDTQLENRIMALERAFEVTELGAGCDRTFYIDPIAGSDDTDC